VIILCVAEATVASETMVMPNPSGLDVVDLGAFKPADEFDSLPVTSLGGRRELRNLKARSNHELLNEDTHESIRYFCRWSNRGGRNGPDQVIGKSEIAINRLQLFSSGSGARQFKFRDQTYLVEALRDIGDIADTKPISHSSAQAMT